MPVEIKPTAFMPDYPHYRRPIKEKVSIFLNNLINGIGPKFATKLNETTQAEGGKSAEVVCTLYKA
jgi:hypothetical protein